jgi:hypothetical protein
VTCRLTEHTKRFVAATSCRELSPGVYRPLLVKCSYRTKREYPYISRARNSSRKNGAKMAGIEELLDVSYSPFYRQFQLLNYARGE